MHVLAGSSGGSAALGAIVWIIAIAAYWAPTIVALCRRPHPDLGPVIVWNFFAFFFLFPWIIALVKAVASTKPQQVQYVAPPGFGPPPGYYPPQQPWPGVSTDYLKPDAQPSAERGPFQPPPDGPR